MQLIAKYLLVALSFVGSAISLFSCDQASDTDAAADEVRMTEYSENLSLVMSENGRRSYHFIAPLVEGYTLAREPYREFRKGVKITTYLNDSLSSVDAVLTANYAIYYENRQLWEAKGNVVVTKSDGKTLYTQQLFWNARTKKIYSNVDSKIVQGGGSDVFIGEGFESDEDFKEWRFRRMKGRMEVDVTPTEGADSLGGSNAQKSPGGSTASSPARSTVGSTTGSTVGSTATSATKRVAASNGDSAASMSEFKSAAEASQGTFEKLTDNPADVLSSRSAPAKRAEKSLGRPQRATSSEQIEQLSLDPKDAERQGGDLSKTTPR